MLRVGVWPRVRRRRRLAGVVCVRGRWVWRVLSHGHRGRWHGGYHAILVLHRVKVSLVRIPVGGRLYRRHDWGRLQRWRTKALHTPLRGSRPATAVRCHSRPPLGVALWTMRERPVDLGPVALRSVALGPIALGSVPATKHALREPHAVGMEGRRLGGDVRGSITKPKRRHGTLQLLLRSAWRRRVSGPLCWCVLHRHIIGPRPRPHAGSGCGGGRRRGGSGRRGGTLLSRGHAAAAVATTCARG